MNNYKQSDEPLLPIDKKNTIEKWIISIFIIVLFSMGFTINRNVNLRKQNTLGANVQKPEDFQIKTTPEILLQTVIPNNNPTEYLSVKNKITLKGKKTENGISLSWNATNSKLDSYKLFKGEVPDPKFPDHEARTFKPEEKNYIWEIMDGKTWHFRICLYIEGQCQIYSNNVSVESPQPPKS